MSEMPAWERDPFDGEPPPWAKDPVAEPDPQWSDMNVPQSIFDTGVKGGRAIVDAVTNPIDTVTGVAKGVYALATDPRAREAVVKEYKDKYGGLKELKNSLIKDPAGTALELGGLAVGGGYAAKKAADLGVTAAKRAAQIPASVGLTTQKPSMMGALSGDVPEGAMDGTIVMPSKAAIDADSKLYQAMLDAGWTPNRIAAKLKQLGPGATMADLQPFWGLQDAAAQTPKGGLRAARTLGVRDARKESRLLETVDATLTPEKFYENLDALKAKRTTEAQPLRREAMAEHKIVKSDTIQRLLERPKFRKGLMAGIELAKDEEARLGIKIPKEDTWFSGLNFDDPNIAVVNTPTLRMLDAAKQGLDVQLKPYRNAYTGKLENLDPEGVELVRMSDEVTNILRNHSDKYAKYLDAWAEPSAQIHALSMGRKILDNDLEVSAKALGRMSEEGKQFVRIGLARDIKDDLRKNPNATIKALNNSKTREILQAVFPSKKAYNAFRKSVLVEAAKARTAGNAIGNSKTARRALGMAEAESKPSIAEDVIETGIDIATGSRIAPIKRFMKRAFTWGDVGDAKTPLLDEMSGVLHSDDPAVQQRALTRFRNRYEANTGMRGNQSSGILDPALRPEDDF